MTYTIQRIYTHVNHDPVRWRSDYFLNTPRPIWPHDSAKICPDTYALAAGAGSGLFLTWAAVPDATKYIVQLCGNSSFQGPTLRARVVSTNQYQLKVISDIVHGNTVYWRVTAIDEQGAVSDKSEVRSIVYECPQPQTGRDGKSGDGNFSNLCELFDVAIEIQGPTMMLSCETSVFGAQWSWKCKNEDETLVVSLQNARWFIEQSPRDDNGKVIGTTVKLKTFDLTSRAVAVKTECNQNQNFTLGLELTFRHEGSGQVFKCYKRKEVLVDSSFGWSYYKPWGNLLPDRTFYPTPYLYTAGFEYSSYVYGPRRVNGAFEKGAGHYFLAGPVFEVATVSKKTKSLSPGFSLVYKEDDKCSSFFPAKTTDLYQIERKIHLEARIPIPKWKCHHVQFPYISVITDIKNEGPYRLAQRQTIKACPVGTPAWTVTGHSQPRIKFLTLADISDQEVSVQVLHVENTSVSIGDTITVRDTNNLFSSVTRNCIGTAYYNIVFDVWEILTCSLPANEIRVELEDTLLAVDGTYTSTVTAEFFLRSTYPNVMPPPVCATNCTRTWNTSFDVWDITSGCPSGCSCGEDPPPPENTELEGQTHVSPCIPDDASITIEFENPWLLDAVCGSKAVLRRISNANWGFTNEGLDDPSSFDEFHWEIVKVEKPIARFITFTFSGETDSVEVTGFWQGFDNSECDPVYVDYPHGAPCPGDTVTASLDPVTGRYKALVTDAAMLGAPIVQNIVTNVANEECGITLTQYPTRVFKPDTCESVPIFTDVQLGAATQVMIAAASEECGEIRYSYRQLRAFLCDSEVGISNFPIDFGDLRFITDISFGPQECSGYATWDWDSETEDWVLTTPCSEGCESLKPVTPSAGPLDLSRTVLCRSSGGVCGINYTTRPISCAEPGSDGEFGDEEVTHVPLSLYQRTVIIGATLDSEGLHFQREVHYVCDFQDAPDIDLEVTTCETGGSGG